MYTILTEEGDFVVDWEQTQINICQDPILRTLTIREKLKSLGSALMFVEVLTVNLEFLDLQ